VVWLGVRSPGTEAPAAIVDRTARMRIRRSPPRPAIRWQQQAPSRRSFNQRRTRRLRRGRAAPLKHRRAQSPPGPLPRTRPQFGAGGTLPGTRERSQQTQVRPHSASRRRHVFDPKRGVDGSCWVAEQGSERPSWREAWPR
jgi:hypothetical protein